MYNHLFYLSKTIIVIIIYVCQLLLFIYFLINCILIFSICIFINYVIQYIIQYL